MNQQTSEATRWFAVIAAFGAGIIGAAHIGKVPAALPAMRVEFAMDMVRAGWVVSIFSATGMIFGMAVGLVSDRLGHIRPALLGMALMALGALAGAYTESAFVLLLTRFIEGFGFLITVITAPSIIASATTPKDRPLATGMWGAFMPTGVGLMLFLSPYIQGAYGWRGSWLVMAGISALWLLVMAVAMRGGNGANKAPPEDLLRNMAITLKTRGPWLLAICFSFYTLAWIALMVWLPTFLVEQRGLPVATAALMTVLVVVINLPGNLLGGWLLHKGVERARIIGVSAIVLCIAGPAIFLDVLPDGARFMACLVYSGLVGMLPAGVLGGAPVFAPSPRQIGTTNGLLVQGSHLGQFIGPPLIAAVVFMAGGWQGGAWVFAICGAGAFLFSILIGREEKRLTHYGNSESKYP